MLDKAFGVGGTSDQYYFQIKLGSLKRQAPDEPFGFRVSIQKGHQKVDNTKDLFTMTDTEVSLNESPLNFYLPSYNPSRPIDFTIFLLDDKQQEFTSFKIGSGQFINDFIKTGKNVFTLSDRFEDETYELNYTLYIEKSRAALFNLTKRASEQTFQELTSPAKEEPPAQQTRSQITRSPVVTRTLTPKKPVTPAKTEEEPEVIPAPEEPAQQTPKPSARSTASRTSAIPETREARTPPLKNQRSAPKAEPEEPKEEEPAPEPPKREFAPRLASKKTPAKVEEEAPAKVSAPAEEEEVKQPAKSASKAVKQTRTETKKVENLLIEKEPPKPQRERVVAEPKRQQGKASKEGENAGSNQKKFILIAVLAAIVVFGLMFIGSGSAKTKKRVVGKRRK